MIPPTLTLPHYSPLQLESCKATLQKQGLDITVASISKTKNNADGERKPWMLCDSEEGCSLESVGKVSAAVTKATLFCSQLPTLTLIPTPTLPRP